MHHLSPAPSPKYPQLGDLRRHCPYLATRRAACPAARRLTAAHHNEVQLTKWIVTSSDCSRALTPRWGPSPLCRPPRGYNVLAPIRYLGRQANVPAPRDVTPRTCAPPPSICQLDPPPVTWHPACPQQRVSPPGRNRLPTTSMKYLGYWPTS